MKTTFLFPITVLLTVVFLWHPVPASAGKIDDESPRILSVSGEGKVSIPVTQVKIQLVVQARGDTPSDAREGAAKDSQRLMAFLREAEVDQLRTTGIALHPLVNHRGGRQEIVGYDAQIQVAFETPIGKAGAVLDGAIEHGAARIGLFQPAATEEEMMEAEKEAIRAGAEAALRRADALLAAMDFTRKDIFRMTVVSAPVYPMRTAMHQRMDAVMEHATPTDIEGGDLEVQATVDLKIRY